MPENPQTEKPELEVKLTELLTEAIEREGAAAVTGATARVLADVIAKTNIAEDLVVSAIVGRVRQLRGATPATSTEKLIVQCVGMVSELPQPSQRVITAAAILRAMLNTYPPDAHNEVLTYALGHVGIQMEFCDEADTQEQGANG